MGDFQKASEEWKPQPVELSEGDLARAEDEAQALFESRRAQDATNHKENVQRLKATLVTIRQGGAARIQAQNDAAAVRASGALIALPSYHVLYRTFRAVSDIHTPHELRYFPARVLGQL